jgi:hypothetical protein
MVVTSRADVICNDQRHLLSSAANVLWLHIALPKLFLNQGKKLIETADYTRSVLLRWTQLTNCPVDKTEKCILHTASLTYGY